MSAQKLLKGSETETSEVLEEANILADERSLTNTQGKTMSFATNRKLNKIALVAIPMVCIKTMVLSQVVLNSK